MPSGSKQESCHYDKVEARNRFVPTRKWSPRLRKGDLERIWTRQQNQRCQLLYSVLH